jgi:hypothetical protein
MKTKERVRYEVDPENRLVLSSKGLATGPAKKLAKKVPGFRTVVDGTFSVDKNNELVYSVTGVSAGDDEGLRLPRRAFGAPRNDDINTIIPGKIKLKGTWSIDEKHDLVCTLDAGRTQQARDTLTLKGELIGAEANSIAFALSTKKASGIETIYVLTLSGAWRADKYNRLLFEVEREGGRTEKLLLRGTWEINKYHELIYTYTKSGTRAVQSLTLKGHWDIVDKYRIAYSVCGESRSRCEFGVEFARYDTDKRAFKYTVAVGVKPETRMLTFKGRWRVRKGLGLMFEMAYRDGEVYSMKFGATCILSGHTECSVELKNTRGKDLGIEIELARELFDGAGQAFVRGLASEKACELVAGVGAKW